MKTEELILDHVTDIGALLAICFMASNGTITRDLALVCASIAVGKRWINYKSGP